MQLVEGSVIPVVCAVCGQETFSVPVMQGTQRIHCSNAHKYNYNVTVIQFEKDSRGQFTIKTWRD